LDRHRETRRQEGSGLSYRERKVPAGIYVVRCAASGQQWAGRAPDLGTIQNRLWFTLRHGSAPHPTLQAAWREHGAESFTFEVLEQLAEEPSAYLREAALKDRLAHWCAALKAEAL
jgi:hypothetical protein